MPSDRAGTARTIQICLFLIEISLAVVMAISAFFLLKILHFKTSWTVRILLTLIGLWIIKSTIWALQSLKNRSAVESNDELLCDDENDGLTLFDSRQASRTKSDLESKPREDEEPGTKKVPTPSNEITETKKFLMDMAKKESEYTSKVSFPMLAVLATVLLHCAIRLLVIVQKLMRSLPWRGRSAREGLIKFFDIPFTIGRKMSPSGSSFHIFSFLNGLQKCNGDGHSNEISSDMALEAVSFDQMSINASHIILNPPRKHPAAKNQLSWLGVSFEDIDMSLTILLKRKGRRSDNGNARCIRSITIRLKMKALEIGIFPSTFDWCKGIGVQIDANAIFDANENRALDPDMHQSFSGFGISVLLSQVNMHRFSSFAHPEEEKPSESVQSKVVSWDKIESSIHLHPKTGSTNHNGDGHRRGSMVTLLRLPSGFVLVHDNEGGIITSTSSLSLPRKVHVNLGDFLCNSRLSMGVHLEDMTTLLQSVDLLVQNVSSSVIRPPSAKAETCTSTKKAKKKTVMKDIELNAGISVHLYAQSNTSAACVDYFSIGAPQAIIHWKKNDQLLKFSADDNCAIDDIKHTCDDLNSLLVVEVTGANLCYEAISGNGNSSIAALDLIILKRISTKLTSGGHADMKESAKHAVIDLGGIFARMDGEVINKLAMIKGASEETKLVVSNLQRRVRGIKESFSIQSKQNSSHISPVASESRKQGTLRCIEVSCDSVDAIIELLESPEYVKDGCGISNIDRVRLALLHKSASITISRQDKGNIPDEATPSMDGANSDVHLPEQLFDSEVQTAKHHLIVATVAHVESSVTFFPHSSLPIIEEASLDTIPHTCRRNNETSFYGNVSKLTFRLAIPLKKPFESPALLSKAIHATFDQLNIYERFSKMADVGPSLTAIPVHEFSFNNLSSESHRGNWPMTQTYALYSSADLAKILQCKGNFCLVETKNHTTGERKESISIQFSKGSTECKISWSTQYQWLQVSCNNRIQRALGRIQKLSSNNAPKKRRPTSHKTSIHIEVDSNVAANIYAFVGVKSMVHAIIEGRSAMNVSISKYPSPHSTTLKQMWKPNISFQAKHIKVMFNKITSPVFTFDELSVQNYLRRADVNEINEYEAKKESPITAFDDELVTDLDGHPLKEIFELKFRGNVLAKFPPDLNFGEVIEDFVLLPKAMANGLNRLKEGHKKPAKKFQLMSIKCSIPLLDISLMGHDPDADPSIENYSPAPAVRTKLRDEFRLCFDAAEILIERNAPPEWTQSQINALDEDDSSTYVYGPAVQGGMVRLTTKHLFCTLHPLNLATPLVRIDDFAINGDLHLAGLSPTTPGIQEGRVVTSLLLCHHHNLAGHGVSTYNDRQCCCSYGMSLYSAGTPVKLYADGRVTCGGLEISYGPVMANSMPRLKECIKRMLPPPKSPGEATAVPLSWWDNIRFFVHGSISVSTDELSFRWLLDSHIHRDKSIVFNCKNFEIAHTVGSFEIKASAIQVSMPGLTYDMSVHPSARDQKPTFYLPHEAESVVSHRQHPLIYVPSFKAGVRFVWQMLLPGGASSDHHCVYMKRETRPNSNECSSAPSDKFAPFRSDGTDVEFDFELLGSDFCDNWIALRIDVLPWFTHFNSTIIPQPDEDKPDPFPKFRSVAIRANTSKLRVATWFQDEDEPAGLCLIVRRVKYNATVDGNKDVVIEGPVKAALLDVSEFKHVVEDLAGDHNQNHELSDLELMASEFGTSQSGNDSKRRKSRFNSFIRSDFLKHKSESLADEDFESTPFMKLQQLSCDIEELDYVVVTGQIDIRNQSLTKILDECKEESVKTGNRNLERETSAFAGVDRTTWSILVSRLRLLWTIEIRDNLMAITKDLIFVAGFMKSQKRQLQLEVLSGNTAHHDHGAKGSLNTSSSLAGEGVELSLHDTPKTLHESMLEYLLEESLDVDLTSIQENGHAFDASNASDQKEEKEGKTLPTLDIHFSNPQVQLHSTRTGGSIILAMEGAHVEGRKFIHFLVTNARNKPGKISPSDLLRKTEHTYTLTNLSAHALSADVDINVGLPWLEVFSPSHCRAHTTVALGERFGINDSFMTQDNDSEWNQELINEEHGSTISHQYMYPPYLHHHEPLAFSKSGLLCPILDQFTFQSTQIFHRPPIHYSTDELICYMKQGLVVGQDEAAVDDIELQIDLLNFNLDSYQFKTTLDVIRNVLLEPPKPHQRHQRFDQGDTEISQKSSGHINTAAATEMEALLRNDNAHRGKKGRQMLRTAAMSLLRDLEDRIALDGSEVFRRVSYTLSKLQWYIQSEDEIDDVLIAFTGFNGQHDYSRDGSIASQFSLEDLRVSSRLPGPDSISFSDPTNVVKSVLGNERSPCQRCGQHFDHSENDLNSCQFHFGQFKCGVWTCCGSTNVLSPGCKSGPHTGREHAAVVRVEALPPTVDGLSLYTHFEVNLFPGILHTLVVQISKSMSRLFMSYFFPGDDDEDDLEAMTTSSDGTDSTDAISMHSDYPLTPKPITRKKSLLIGGKGSSSMANPSTPEELSESKALGNIPDLNLQKEEKKEGEITFIKVWRVGYVDVNVSLGGFKRLPLTSLDLSVPAYSKAYELGTWEYHSRKYLTYLVREVLKSGASSGLDKFRRKVMGSSASPSPGQRGDQMESIVPRIISSPRSVPPMPSISDSGPVDAESFTGKHLQRPVGAADILGTPAKKSSKKKKKISFKSR